MSLAENGKGWQGWITNLLLILVLAFGGTIWAMERGERSKQQETFLAWQKDVNQEQRMQDERILRLEFRFENIEKRLDEISRKLDTLLNPARTP